MGGHSVGWTREHSIGRRKNRTCGENSGENGQYGIYVTGVGCGYIVLEQICAICSIVITASRSPRKHREQCQEKETFHKTFGWFNFGARPN